MQKGRAENQGSRTFEGQGRLSRWRFQSVRPARQGLFTVALESASDNARSWVIIFDTEGVPRWWFLARTLALGAAVLPDGTVTWPRAYGDGYGMHSRVAHEVHTLSGRLLRAVRTKGWFTDGHEYRQLPDGDVLLDGYFPFGNVDLSRYGGPENARIVSPEIQEVSRKGRVVWRWNARGHIPLSDVGQWWPRVLRNPHPSPGRSRSYDIFHINSIDPWGRRQLVISGRHVNAVYGIRRKTGDVIWKLGGTKSEASLRVRHDPLKSRLFGGQHDARINKGGILTSGST